jgi:hypothetical protein
MPSESQARGIKRGAWEGGRAYIHTCKRRARGMLVGFTPLRGLRRVTSRDVSVALSEGDFSFSRGERGFAEMPNRVGSLGGTRK